jgi:hypothetical protein
VICGFSRVGGGIQHPASSIQHPASSIENWSGQQKFRIFGISGYNPHFAVREEEFFSATPGGFAGFF